MKTSSVLAALLLTLGLSPAANALQFKLCIGSYRDDTINDTVNVAVKIADSVKVGTAIIEINRSSPRALIAPLETTLALSGIEGAVQYSGTAGQTTLSYSYPFSQTTETTSTEPVEATLKIGSQVIALQCKVLKNP